MASKQLRMAEHPGTAGHSGEPEIGRVSQDRCHQRHAVFGWISGTKMHEPIGKSGPSMNFNQKLGDP